MADTRKKPTIKRKLLSSINRQKLIDPINLLTPKRIDIAAKTIFARAYIDGNTSKWPEIVYKEHIRAFNNFRESEPLKSSYLDFKNSFISTIDGIRAGDDWKHKAPIHRNKHYLMNGAHRTAASIVLNDKINVTTPKDRYEYNWGYEYFKSVIDDIPSISEDVLDYMTIEYVSLKQKNVFIAIIFPAAANFH